MTMPHSHVCVWAGGGQQSPLTQGYSNGGDFAPKGGIGQCPETFG